jgi:hypothetical protein
MTGIVFAGTQSRSTPAFLTISAVSGKASPEVAFDGIEMSSYKENRRILEQ